MITPPRLPLLEAMAEKYADRRLLAGWQCIYVQHLLASNMACLEFLETMGLDRNNIWVFGKGYSTSVPVLESLRSRGWAVWNPSDYAYDRPFDELIIKQIASVLTSDTDRSRPLLVIDEGALASRAIARTNYKFDRLALVELTSRGAEHYRLVADRWPVIDVARSVIKKGIENRYIAASMIENLLRFAPDQLSDPVKASIGLLGAGAIGSAICMQMRERGYSLQIYDETAGLNTVGSLAELIDRCTTILSSTGGGPDWIGSLEGGLGEKLLVNCGSSDVEFSPWKLRASAMERGGSFSIENSCRPWAGKITIRGRQSTLVLPRGGFPINFDGSPDPISPSTVQLTRAALMAGALQAVEADHSGVIVLDEAVQAWIAALYERHS
jgi:hypothetical protein